MQVHESSLLKKQFFSLCCGHRVSWESDICGYNRKRQGRLRRGWVQVQGGFLGALGSKHSALQPAWLSHAGGEAFEVTDHQ